MINLSLLSDAELTVIVKNDLGFFLVPIKQAQKRYKRYTSSLGNMTAHSKLVEMNLPRIAVSLYKQRDVNFVKAMETQCTKLIDDIVSIASETLERELSENDLCKMNKENLLEFIMKYINDDARNHMDFDLFWVQMKLIDAYDLEEKKEYILNAPSIQKMIKDDEDSLEGKEDNHIMESADEIKPSEEKQTVKKLKVKKLTPQEKAEKNKAALLAKEMARQEDVIITETEEDETEISNKDVGLEKLNQTFQNDAKTDNDSKEAGMKDYIGIISIKSSYYNFTPIGVYENGAFEQFSETELEYMLPKSLLHNINLSYSFWDERQSNLMQSHFAENQVVVLKCNLDELGININPSDGKINPTGYKFPAFDGFNQGKLCFPSDIGLYPAISMENLRDDVSTKKIIRLNQVDHMVGEKVLVRFREGFMAGPFEIKYRQQDDEYYIKMEAIEGKHFVEGYNLADCKRISLDPSLSIENRFEYADRTYFVIKDQAVKEVKDFISDEDLLESFYSALKTEKPGYFPVKSEELIAKIGESQIVGDNIPDVIKEKRINRIKELFGSKENLSRLCEESSNLVWELLVRNDKAMESILESHPELLEKIPAIKAIQTRTENERAKLKRIQAEIEETKNKKALDEVQQERESSAQIEKKYAKEISEKQEELEKLCEFVGAVKDLKEATDKHNKLKEEEAYLENHKAHLLSDTKNLENEFIRLVNNNSEKMASITFDGFMSSKMLQAASEWEANIERDTLESLVEEINAVDTGDQEKKVLLEYIIKTIQHVRPGYGKNDIINILTCVTQGFLTVFSGAPGCGKTSICNIIGRTLGLNSFEKKNSRLKTLRRYIPVSVERGWTSKRDFIGYYNPLTKSFEENNREIFDGLRLLDAEKRKNYEKWPFIILLDEANLSPMEYYWADFMNVCDDLTDNSTINLGNDKVFEIPKTLHFLATINNDHTTERMSPRLVDRAWVISLPKVPYSPQNLSITDDMIECISWEKLSELFDESNLQGHEMDSEAKGVYEGVKECISKLNIYVSPRVEQAIFRYWVSASRIMEGDEYAPASLIALDYALSQKILPKISGSGEEYEQGLVELQKYCDNKGLTLSAKLLNAIIEKGNRQMKYFQFFN